MIKRFIATVFATLAVVCTSCKDKTDPNNGNTNPSVPTAIGLSLSSVQADAAGGKYEVAITSPARPKVSGMPGWITITDGTFKDYKISVTLNVSANDTYEERVATLTVSASGVSDVAITVSQAGKEEIKDPALPNNTAVSRTMELGLGWNMGNHFDAYSNGVANETAWGGTPATEATFRGVKAAGFSTVRIPVTWLGHIGEAPDYTLDEAWLNRVYEVVGYAEKAGLNVILNTHHDEDHGDAHWLNLAGAFNSEDTNSQIKEEIAAVWTQISVKFREKGDFLMLESFNELIYGDQWSIGSQPEKKGQIINEWNQVFVDAVRATGGNNSARWLGVPGYAASPQYLQYFTLPTDPASKTMVAFHCYDPYDYTIGSRQLPDWGHTGSSVPDGEEQLKQLFNSLYTNYVARNIPIYMGEFGCSMRNFSDKKAWAFYLYYMEYMVKVSRVFGISPVLWDNENEGYGQEHHPYINHGTGDYIDHSKEVVDVMVKAWSTNSDSYTLQSVYDSAPRF